MNNIASTLTFLFLSFSVLAQVDHSDPNRPGTSVLSHVKDSLYNPSGRVRASHMTEQDEQMLAKFRSTSARMKLSESGTKPMHLLDSTITELSSGVVSAKYSYVYSAKGEKIESVQYRLEWVEGEEVFLPFRKTQYEYEQFGKMTYYMEERWDNSKGDWRPQYEVITSYANAEYVSSEIGYIWNNDNASLEGWYKINYEYQSYGKRTHYYTYSWSAESGTWIGDQKDTRTYDNNLNWNGTKFYTWDNELSDWEIYKKGEFSLDSDGNRTLSLYSTWEVEGESWVNAYKFEYQNENGFRKYGEYFAWDLDAEAWDKPSWKYDYEYDNFGNRTFYLTHFHDTELEEWIPDTKEEKSFNQYNQLTFSAKYSWDSALKLWTSGYVKKTLVYDINILVNESWEVWDSDKNSWRYADKTIYVYTDGILKERLLYYGSYDDFNVWQANQRKIYFYNTYDKIDYELDYLWNSESNVWSEQFHERKDYYYTIIKGTQEITFTDELSIDENVETIELAATSNSDLTVTYTSSDKSVATIEGNEVTILALGTSTITASQEGNGEYEAAEPVSRTLNVVVTEVDDQTLDQQDKMLILPNPVDDVFSFSDDFGKVNQVVIYNMQGRVVKTFNRQQRAYNVSDLPTGLYSMLIQADSKLFSKKLLKK